MLLSILKKNYWRLMVIQLSSTFVIMKKLMILSFLTKSACF